MSKICYLISSNHSNAGKTSLTSSLALFYQSQNKRVRLFKLGPDFLDPLFHCSVGFICTNLDLWMMGKKYCEKQLNEALNQFDVVLIEGNMGLFDGQYNVFDISSTWKIPILLILSAKGVAETIVAEAYGLCHFKKNIHLQGIFINNIQSKRHQTLIEDEFSKTTLPYLGAIYQTKKSIQKVHLGLWDQSSKDFLFSYCKDIKNSKIYSLPSSNICVASEKISFQYANLKHVTIAIASDKCFSFMYKQNINYLKQSGARLIFVSPIENNALPDCDSLYLPGGYPEFFIKKLEKNQRFKENLKQHIVNQKKVYAECGGMFVLSKSVFLDDQLYSLYNLLPLEIQLKKSAQSLGMHQLKFADENIQGHSFHYSCINTKLKPKMYAQGAWGKDSVEPIYQHESIIATYFHSFWVNKPKWVDFCFK